MSKKELVVYNVNLNIIEIVPVNRIAKIDKSSFGNLHTVWINDIEMTGIGEILVLGWL